MSINNKRSYTEYTVTQPTTDFAIGFDDFDEGGKDNILVTLNGVLVESLGYAAIRKNESTVTITPAITEGTVRLTRETDIDEPFHKFTAGALFSAKSMDENFQQVRHSQQEVRDGFVFLEYNTNGIVQASKEATAQAKAATIEATASAVRAETAADIAVQAVGSLQGVVDAATTATTKANTATATATTAASQANAATATAQNAALAATVAKQEAQTATANANAATVDTLAATGRANSAADVVANLVVGKVRAQDVSTVDGSTQAVKNTEFRNELDALPFEGGILADTFVTVTANGVGTVPTTLRDILSKRILVDSFGAKGDGVTQDRVAIQKAIDSCHALYLATGTPVTLYYTSGSTYVAHLLNIKEGVNHVCEGNATILKTPALPEELESTLIYRAMLSIESVDFSSANLEHRVLISGITLDGNNGNMNWTVGTFNQQQASSLKLYNTTIPTGKRFKIELRNFKMINSVADGVTISQNIDIIGDNIDMSECFRGGIVHTGGNTVAKFSNVTGENANLHIEIDGAGHGGKFDLHATYSNFEIDRVTGQDAVWGGFYATPSDGSNITLNNFKCHSTGFYIQGGYGDTNNPNAVMNFNDCYFAYSSAEGDSTVYFPSNLNFSNTELRHIGGTGIGLTWYWQTSSGSTSSRKAIFKNGCKFTCVNGTPAEAILSYISDNTANNRFEFTDTLFEGFVTSFNALSGFHGLFGDGCVFNTALAVDIKTYGTVQNADIEFGNIKLGAACTTFIFCYFQTEQNNKVRFSGTTLDGSKIPFSNGGDFNTVNGLLTLNGDSKPSSANVAWTNTVWQVVKAGAGQGFLYKLYNPTHKRGADWKLVSHIPNAGNTAGRPSAASVDVGLTYINTETSKIDTWTGTAWI